MIEHDSPENPLYVFDEITTGIDYPEEVLTGVGLSSGIGMGPAFVLDSVSPEVSEYTIAESEIESELKRFEKARQRSYNQIAQLLTKSEVFSSSDNEEITLLLEAHLGMLYGSRLVRGVKNHIENERINAEAAVRIEVEDMERVFAELDDAYISGRGNDVAEVGKRLLHNLADQKFTAIKNIPDGGILLSEEITPTDLAAIPEGRIAGFMTLVGARQGHTGIMARSLGIPAVASVGSMPKFLHANSRVIVDGNEGILVVNPSIRTWAEYESKKKQYEVERAHNERLKDLPAKTADKVDIAVEGNLTNLSDMEKIMLSGAAGVGLVRTEFMFMGRDDLPSAEEQYETLKDIVLAAKGLPITIRTMDIGGDKMAPALHKRFGSGPNPALGMRAVRLSLYEPSLLEAQCEAILRAGKFGKVEVLVPMISSPQEILRVRDIMDKTSEALTEQGIEICDIPPIGAMIEIPAAVLVADELAKVCDFFSLGTNDLVQYTLAADRSDEAMGSYYNPAHPAVIKMIRLTIDAAKHAKIPVSVCGELAGDPLMLPLFIALGIRSISVQASLIPEVKDWIRGMNVRKLRNILSDKKLTTAEGVKEILDDMARLCEQPKGLVVRH